MSPILLGSVYLCVVLAPLALSWLGGWPPRSVWDELASGAGMLAFAIILVEFVLSGRFRSVSRRIGMDVTMRLHQLLARAALVLGLLHPYLYASPFTPQRPWDATRAETLTDDLTALAGGVAAWVLLGALVALSIGRDRIGYKHEAWRLGHGLGALLLAGLLLHHALEAGRYSQAPLLAGLWIALFSVALLTLVWIYLLSPALRRRRPWTVRSVRPAGLRTWELTLEPDDHDGLRYEAGQFAWISVGRSAWSLHENPFSIASAPGEGPALRFVIKELGDFTRTLGRIRRGERAFVDGPYGHIVLTGRKEPGLMLIAGGVGVAPMLGLLRQLRIDEDPRPATVVYGNRTADQIVAREELDAVAGRSGCAVVHVLSEPPAGWTGERGFSDGALVRRLFRPEMTRWLFVICGPPVMMTSVEDALIDLGVPPRQILSERFQYD